MTDEQKSPPVDADRDQIGKVLGRVASGVFVLTAGDGTGRETGMLASWVQQASFEPPMVSVAVNRKRYLNEWIEATGLVALSLIEEGDKSSLKQFGMGFEPDEPAFTGVEVGRTASGLPVLKNSLGCLAGRVHSQFPAGDHLVYLVEITEAGAGTTLENGRPMVHIRRNGFRY